MICTHDDEHARPFQIGVPPDFKQRADIQVVLQSIASYKVNYSLSFRRKFYEYDFATVLALLIGKEPSDPQ